jgi:LEA14-like dessication related protein
VVVLPEHKEWWRKKMERGDRTRAGELITLEWVESVVGEMEQMKW